MTVYFHLGHHTLLLRTVYFIAVYRILYTAIKYTVLKSKVCYPNWKYTVLTSKFTISEYGSKCKLYGLMRNASGLFIKSIRSFWFSQKDRIFSIRTVFFTHNPASKDDWTKEPVRGPIVFGPWVPEGPYTLKQKKVIRPIFQPGIWNV